MSKYVRLRDCLLTTNSEEYGRCITCGAIKPFEELEAGHLHHADGLDFEEKNINAQCHRCNVHLHGNGAIYAIKVDQKWGSGTNDELYIRKLRANKIDDFALDKIKEDLYNKVKKLKDRYEK